MTTQNRQTLKGYFSFGKRPTASNFVDLIDSSLIMYDEGFIKTATDGLKIITLGDSQALLSFEGPNSPAPEWSLGFIDNQNNALTVKRGAVRQTDDAVVLSLWDRPPETNPAAWKGYDALPYVGIGVETPGAKLDVDGLVRSHGRAGQLVDVPADGKPHTISGAADLRGCVAFEVTAGVGIPNTGRFALVHALALNTYNPSRWDNFFWPIFGGKTPIRQIHAFYSRRADRLRLSWGARPDATEVDKHGKQARFALQIRSRSPYLVGGQPANIRAFVTKLWFDPDMDWAATGVTPPPPPKKDA